jgi:crotonobetainyl-CoA:carnitine CoA-transferase CaiB-like acyl-CoA transferase
VSLGVVQQPQFETWRASWVARIGSPDPRFANGDLRRKHATKCIGDARALFATRPAAQWEQELSEAGIPAAWCAK